MKSEILPLTGLRFVAAFYVFVFHIHIRWPFMENQYGNNIFGQGAIGMSLFFILSGFVLTYQYADGNNNKEKYFINRFARIYPVYIVAALATLPWFGVENFLQGIVLVIANIFLIQAWFPQLFTLWNNGASWSISVEAFCYLLLPFLLPKIIKCNTKQLFFIIMGSYFFSAIPGVVVKLFDGQYNNIFYSMPIFRVPEFLIGISVALLVRSGYVYKKGMTLQFVAVSIMLIYIAILGQNMPIYIGHNWIVVPFIAFMIFSLTTGKGLIAKLLSNRLSVWFGKISYCFYSFQAMIILFLLNHRDAVIKSFPALGTNLVLLLACFVVLVLLSAVGYYFIEEPARKRIRKIR